MSLTRLAVISRDGSEEGGDAPFLRRFIEDEREPIFQSWAFCAADTYNISLPPAVFFILLQYSSSFLLLYMLKGILQYTPTSQDPEDSGRMERRTRLADRIELLPSPSLQQRTRVLVRPGSSASLLNSSPSLRTSATESSESSL